MDFGGCMTSYDFICGFCRPEGLVEVEHLLEVTPLIIEIVHLVEAHLNEIGVGGDADQTLIITAGGDAG